MLFYKEHKQKLSDKFSVSIIRLSTKINKVKEHGVVDFKFLYTSRLSDDYSYPKNIDFEISDFLDIKVEAL